MKSAIQQYVQFGLIAGLLSFSSFSSAEVKTIAEMENRFNDGITLDNRGSLYVSNAGYYGWEGLEGTQVNRLQKDGTQSVWVDGLSGPLGSAFDSEGNMYISNFNTGDVYKRTKHGITSHFSTIDGGGGVAIDKNNTIYVASYQGGSIYQIDRHGNATLYSDDPLLRGGPIGLTFDKHHNLYVGNYDDGKIIKIDKHGAVSELVTMEVAGNHVAYLVYAAGNLYATSMNTNKIYKVTLTGEISEFAGSGAYGHEDGTNEAAQFKLPNGIATNKQQNRLYVTEWYSAYIRTIDIDNDCVEEENIID